MILGFAPSSQEESLLVPSDAFLALVQFLQRDPDAAIDLLVDISAIEHISSSQTCFFKPNHPEPLIEVFYLFRSSKLGYRLRLSLLLTPKENSVPSLSSIFFGATWLEQELWDLLGVYPEGHPHLKRLILYNGFSGHPLRRRYPISKDQAQVPIYKTE